MNFRNIFISILFINTLHGASGDVVIDIIQPSGLRKGTLLTPANNFYIGFDGSGNLITKAGSGSGASWGSITGTLADQTDLSTALSGKEPSITAGTSSQYWSGDKTWQTLDAASVGLGNVENTALSTWAGSASITTLGTITTGTVPAANVSGLGGAAQLNVGTTAGTVAAGDDNRFHSAVTIDASLIDILDITGQDISAIDLGADKLWFWDDSEGKMRPLDLGTGLSISGTTLNASGGGSGHTIEDDGTPMTARAALNFTGSGVTVTDDSMNDATVIDIAAASSATASVNVQTGTSYTLQLSDAGKVVVFTHADPVTVELPDEDSVTWPANTQFVVAQYGAGAVTVAGEDDAEINGAASVENYGQYKAMSFIRVGADEWFAMGAKD